MRKRQGLLAQIEAGALDSRTSLADVLRKCLTLGAYAGSAELRDWAHLELTGYENHDGDVPPYRVIFAPLLADGFHGPVQFSRKQMAIEHMPDFTRAALRDGLVVPAGVGQLARLALKSEGTGLLPDRLASLVPYMNQSGKYGASFERMYYEVSPYAFGEILDAIRTKLTAMVAELRAAGFTDTQIPSREAADQAFQVVIRGAKRSPITINNAIGEGATVLATQMPTPTNESTIPAWIRGPWGFLVGSGTLAGAYAAFAAGQGWPPF